MLKPQVRAQRRQWYKRQNQKKKEDENRAQKPAAMDRCFGLLWSHQHVRNSCPCPCPLKSNFFVWQQQGFNYPDPGTTVAFARMPVALMYPIYTLTLSSQATSHKSTIFHHIDIDHVGTQSSFASCAMLMRPNNAETAVHGC